MLQKLLDEIQKGGTLNATTLSTRLSVNPALLGLMLEDLERRGILTRLAAGCSGGSSCGGCPTTASCENPGRVWMLAGPKNSLT
jgi:hypothetical protein